MNLATIRSKSDLLIEARRTLGLTREQFGELLHSSKRTVARWEVGESSPATMDLFDLARHIYPRNAKLAEEIALAGGATLEKIGIVTAPSLPSIPGHVLADAILCAAADALKAVPETVRTAVLAAFKRARELRMTVEDVERALAKR